MTRGVLAALVLLALSASAEAATPQDLYLQGKYSAAIAAGLAQKDAAGYALAARAELAAEMMHGKPCLACLKRAGADAEKSVNADPKKADGHIYLALAIGYESRLIGIVAAGAQHNAPRAKQELDAALACDPSNPFALAALGGWHIEIVRAGGEAMAKWMYGANVPDGLANFAKAFALSPGNVALRYQYALSLAGYDLETYRGNIEDALNRAAAGKPNGAYEAFAQKRAIELRDVLKREDIETFDTLVRRDQGYAD
jgi:hypothetical protein